jgi:hypothetical protein
MIRGRDFFDLYRQVLLIVTTSYLLVRAWGLIAWLLMGTRLGRESAWARRTDRLFRHYLLVQLLGIRWRTFAADLIQVAVLSIILGYLIWLHWHW